MKLLLLTCLVASAFAAPSARTRRDILPGDARYHHVGSSHHEGQEHRQNDAEIARALARSSGCLSSLAIARGYEVPESNPEIPIPDSKIVTEQDVGAAVKAAFTPYQATFPGAEQAAEQPQSSATLVNQEPVVSVKSVDAVSVAEAAAPVKESDKSQIEYPIAEKETKFEAKTAIDSKNYAQEIPSPNFAKSQESVKSTGQDYQTKRRNKVPAASVSVAAVQVNPSESIAAQSNVQAAPAQTETKVTAESASVAADQAAVQVPSSENVAVQSNVEASPVQTETKVAAEFASIAADQAAVQVPSSENVAVQSNVEASPVQTETKIAAESTSVAADQAAVQVPSSENVVVPSNVEASPVQTETKVAAEFASVAANQAAVQVPSSENVAVQSNVEASPVQTETKIAAESTSVAADQAAVQVPSSENVVVQSNVEASPVQTETKVAAESASVAADQAAVQVPSSENVAVQSNVEDSQNKKETKVETKSTAVAEDQTTFEQAPLKSFVAQPYVGDSQSTVETEVEAKPVIPAENQVEAQAVASRSFAENPAYAKSDVYVSAHEVQTPFEAKFASQTQNDASHSFPLKSAIEAKSAEKEVASEAASATDGSATPTQPKPSSYFGAAFNPAFASRVGQTFPSPAYTPAYTPGYTPAYTPGYNAFDQTRYNPAFNPGYGYNPGFDGYNKNYNGYYNSNYGKFGGYNGATYPGQPFGFGTYPGFDQSLKGKTTINPYAPTGFPYPYPVDYNKNVPYVPSSAFPFRSTFPIAEPVAPSAAVQQPKAESTGVEASEDQSQFAKNYQSPESWVQPTAAPFTAFAQPQNAGQWGIRQ